MGRGGRERVLKQPRGHGAENSDVVRAMAMNGLPCIFVSAGRSTRKAESRKQKTKCWKRASFWALKQRPNPPAAINFR